MKKMYDKMACEYQNSGLQKQESIKSKDSMDSINFKNRGEVNIEEMISSQTLFNFLSSQQKPSLTGNNTHSRNSTIKLYNTENIQLNQQKNKLPSINPRYKKQYE